MNAETAPPGPLPRLLFFRWIRAGQPQFLLDQLADQLSCLRRFFHVELVDRDDCDFDEECDRFQPDLVLFESGVYAGPRRMRNLDTHPSVPRLGFLNADAFDPVRAAFVSDMAAWGVDTFFTVSAAMAGYTPELADRLYCWPNFIDPAVHRDHGLPKVVPIVLTGSRARHYPWRNRVSRVLAQNYPVLTMPHFGWSASSGARRMATGEAYSRMIGSAWMAPSCGSFTQDLVRKHLEIPAAGTCLVAQRTAALEAAGYVDMVNCVFADEDDVLEKVDRLFSDIDELEAITAAGHRLVHSRHTAAQRRQIRDWYDLYAETGSVEGIVQRNPLAPLVRADSPPEPRDVLVVPTEDRAWIRTGWQHQSEGRYAAALRAFTGASNYQYMPEAEVGKAITMLHAGDLRAAATTIVTLLDHNDRHYGPVDPDPVQWAVHVRVLLCRGQVDEAWAALAAHPGIRHPELERIRAAVGSLAGEAPPAADCAPRASVNPLPPLEWPAWLRSLQDQLVRNQQTPLADRLAELAPGGDPAVAGPASVGRAPVAAATGPSVRTRGEAPRRTPRWRPPAGEWLRSAARWWVTAPWLETLSEVVEREELDQVLIVGSTRFGLRERSLRLAASRNPRMPEVATIAASRPAAVGPARSPETLVFLGAHADLGDVDADAIGRARVIVVEDVWRAERVALVGELLGRGFELVDHSAGRGGYYVLRGRLGPMRSTTPAAPGADVGFPKMR